LLNAKIRNLILLRSDITDRILQVFVLVNCPNIQHGIINEVPFGSYSEGGTAAGESDGIAGAPSCFQPYIQVTE